MGLMCSWIAIRTEAKAEVLEHLGLVETGELVEPYSREGLISVHQNSNGWLYIFAEDFDWADGPRVLDLSRFGLTLGIQTEDEVDMTCLVRAAEHGRKLWKVSHVNDEGEQLKAFGKVPEDFARIRRKYRRLQRERDDADYLWEIPLALARQLSGYRVDEDPIEFVALDPVAGPAPVVAEKVRRGGLVSRILSVFK
jgi:hypothetical protein